MYLQALLPCIAQLSKLPLRELSLDVQRFPADSAAFQALFWQLPQTLRQLFVMRTPPGRCDTILGAEPLFSASPLARLQTTALRQVAFRGMLANLLISTTMCAQNWER